MFITLTALGVVAPAFALEVKLLCSIKLTTAFPSGDVERENFTDVIDVIDNNNGVFITQQASKLASLNTIKSPRTLSLDNYSDSNKWNIEVTRQARTGQIVRTSITIDRNTGILFYSKDWDRGKIVDSATGSCEKIDVTKRKF